MQPAANAAREESMDDENQRRQEEVRPLKHAIIRAFGISPERVPIPVGIWIFKDKITIEEFEGRGRDTIDHNFYRDTWTEQQTTAVQAYLDYTPSWVEEKEQRP